MKGSIFCLCTVPFSEKRATFALPPRLIEPWSVAARFAEPPIDSRNSVGVLNNGDNEAQNERTTMALCIVGDPGARLPLAVVPIGTVLPFVGHALGGQAERARLIKKRVEISLAMLSSSLRLASSRPALDDQPVHNFAVPRRYYINNNPAG